MSTTQVDPTDRSVLERNYDYAQKDVQLLAEWYECDTRRMIELLAENEITLSAKDDLRFGPYYRSA